MDSEGTQEGTQEGTRFFFSASGDGRVPRRGEGDASADSETRFYGELRSVAEQVFLVLRSKL